MFILSKLIPESSYSRRTPLAALADVVMQCSTCNGQQAWEAAPGQQGAAGEFRHRQAAPVPCRLISPPRLLKGLLAHSSSGTRIQFTSARTAWSSLNTSCTYLHAAPGLITAYTHSIRDGSAAN